MAPSLKPGLENDTEQRIVDAARKLVVKALRRDRTIASVRKMFENAISLAGGILATVRHVNGPSRPKACKTGCHYCCYLQADVTVPEVLHVASYISENFSETEMESLKTRVHTAHGRVRGLNEYERLFSRIPCPLLTQGKCSVYEARPLVCRGYNSFSWVACAQELNYSRSWKPVPHDVAERNIYSDVQDGIIAGLADLGLPSEPLELIAALQIALDEPDSEQRWLAGESVFAPAAIGDE